MTSTEYVRRRQMLSVTAPVTLTRLQLGTLIDNVGAAGSVTVTLPADASPGDTFHADTQAAQALVFYAGTAGVFTLVGVAGTAGQSLRFSGVVGQSCELICTGAAAWRVRNPIGAGLSVS
jgi:hypothetical protein